MFKILETIPKVFAWLQIAVAPLIVCGTAGFLIYANRPDTIGLTIAILTTVVGLVLGTIWANRVKRKRGVLEHMSRIIATPELNRQVEEPN